MQLLSLALLFVGEVTVIYAEEIGAKLFGKLSLGFVPAFVPTLVPLVIGALCLVAGYMLGMRAFQNIWAVTAVSFGTILVAEPLFDYFYIGQVPGLGAGIGVGLGALGILATLIIR